MVRFRGSFFSVGFSVAVFFVSSLVVSDNNGFLPDKAVDRIGYGRIQRINYSPDAKLITLTTSVGVRIIDAVSLKQAGFIRLENFAVDLGFMSHERVAIATTNGLKIFDLNNPRYSINSPLQVQRTPIQTVAISTDEEWMAVGTIIQEGKKKEQSEVFVYAVGEDETSLSQIFILEGEVVDVTFDPGPSGMDQRIAVASKTEIFIWRKSSTESIFRNIQKGILPVDLVINNITFNSDGSHLLIGAYNTQTNSSEIYRQVVADPRPEFVTQIPNEEIFDIIFHPTQRNFLAIATDQKLRVWEVFQSDATQKGSPLLNRDFSADSITLAFHPKKKVLAIGADNNPLNQSFVLFKLGLADIAVPINTEFTDFYPQVFSIHSSFTTTNRQLLVNYKSKKAVIWDLEEMTEKLNLPFPSKVNDIKLSPSADEVAIALQSNEIKVLDITSDPPSDSAAQSGLSHPETTISNVVAYDPSGQWIGSVAKDGSVRVRQKGAPQFENDLDFKGIPLIDISFNFDGTVIALLTANNTVALYQVSLDQGIQKFTGKSGDSVLNIGAAGAKVAFSPVKDDNRFIIGLKNGFVQFYDILKDRSILQTHQLSVDKSVAGGEVAALGISLDGRFVAVGIDNSILMWSHGNPEEGVQQFSGHTEKVTGLVFSRLDDGTNLLASSSLDGTVLIWDIGILVKEERTGELIDLIEPNRTTEVAVTDRIRVRVPTFSQLNMETLTPFNFRVEGKLESGSIITYSQNEKQYAVEGTNMITFNPGSILREKETITIRVSSGIEDVNGKFLEATALEFTTGLIVWPGDTNRDGNVNVFDILPVGRFWGLTGELRRKGNSSWRLQPAISWSNKQATYADANGDGVINLDDVFTINDNWKKIVDGGIALPVPNSPIQSQFSDSEMIEIYEKMYFGLKNRSREIGAGSELAVALRKIIDQLRMQSIPTVTKLLNNYPNPFNPETWIPFQLAEPQEVSIAIYDLKGRKVRGLDLGYKKAGYYLSRAKAAYWDGRSDWGELIASGIYFYRIKAGNFSGQKRLIILK